MPAYFVWSKPSLVVVIEAASEQDAAEAFIELPMTTTRERCSRQGTCSPRRRQSAAAPDRLAQLHDPLLKLFDLLTWARFRFRH